MHSNVTLTIANGKQEGKEYAFDQPCVGYIGRGRDCEIVLPNEPEYHLVSRHHCLLDIDPPEIRVSDCSSLNGTFVNGVRIGKVKTHAHVETSLADGDELRVGRTVFRVGVEISARCVNCGAVLGTSDIEFMEGETKDRRCSVCRQKLAEIDALREVYSM
jgi:eukaryotic-like serine/threonine-protein kinase